MSDADDKNDQVSADDVADETTDGTDDTDDADGADGDAAGDEEKPLGPKGEKALQAIKDKERAARKELREWKALGLTPEQIRELKKAGSKDGSDDKPDLDKIRADAKAEAAAEALRERVSDKIEAKARAFADPEDAVAILLRSNEIDDFIDDGKVDVDAIAEALTDLGKKKPHLLAQGGKRFQGSADGGVRNGSSKPTQLTRADVQRLAKEGKHSEINKARKEGRLADLMSGK